MRAPVLGLVVATAVATPMAAWGLWASTAGGSVPVVADTLSNPTGVAAACTDVGRNSTMTLTWTASPDPYVTGYEVVRTSSGGAVVTASVAGRTTASWVSSSPAGDRKPVSYAFTIRALAAGTSWTAAPVAATGVPSYDRNSCTTL